jgi:hypothetical protein
MQLDRTSHTFTLRNNPSQLLPGWIIGVILFIAVGLPQIQSLIAFFNFLSPLLLLPILALVSFSSLTTTYRFYQYCRIWQAQTLQLHYAQRTLDLSLRNRLGQTRQFSCSHHQILDLQPFCSTRPSSDTKGCYGLRLFLKNERQPVTLTDGHFELQTMGNLAQELRQALHLPLKPPYRGIADLGHENMPSRILQQSAERLVYRLSYAKAILPFYAFGGLFAGFFLLFPWLLLSSPKAVLSAKILVTFFGVLPSLGFLWLVQTVGFYETWVFDRYSSTFQLNRQRLVGQKHQTLTIRDITQLSLTTAVPTLNSTKESYQVILTAPSLPIGQNAANPTGRTLYASTDLAAAQAFCDHLQTYMPHLASPVGSALRAS